ncbi:hypothetical protein EB796_006018 [Bugula neritina]|uniref:Complex I-MWFE n=1 Tax=Bugula neritina TaxID=10212 RepID=A0A7J7KAG7_BUGNE|nr:hypothetical protein EB796_019658 [Bugula neritina]KAF6035662.1 hypothetical protein EB796_006018 [Bugula neritina]
MWYEIIPSIAVVGTLIWLPQPIMWACNKLTMNGHVRSRDWCIDAHNHNLFYRDYRLTGNNYVVNGLEVLDDAPAKPCSKV